MNKWIKYIVMTVLVVVITLWSENTYVHAEGEVIRFGSETYEWPQGKEEPIGVYVEAAQPMSLVDMRISYDPSVLEYRSGGEQLSDGGVRVTGGAGGNRQYSAMLYFKPIQPGSTDIKIEGATINYASGETIEATGVSAPVRIPVGQGAGLTALLVNGRSVEGFTRDMLSYTIDVQSDATVLNVEATAENVDTRIAISDTALTGASNTITVTTSAPSGNGAVYTLYVNRSVANVNADTPDVQNHGQENNTQPIPGKEAQAGDLREDMSQSGSLFLMNKEPILFGAAGVICLLVILFVVIRSLRKNGKKKSAARRKSIGRTEESRRNSDQPLRRERTRTERVSAEKKRKKLKPKSELPDGKNRRGESAGKACKNCEERNGSLNRRRRSDHRGAQADPAYPSRSKQPPRSHSKTGVKKSGSEMEAEPKEIVSSVADAVLVQKTISAIEEPADVKGTISATAESASVKETISTTAETVIVETKEESAPGSREIEREVEIEVQHVSMQFRREKDEATSIKELLIRTLKRQRSYEMFKALDDVSFTIYKGEVVGIIGTNGSGKSTILKIISGVLAPTAGKVNVDKNKIQLLTLGTGFDFELTGRENVYLNGAVIGYTKKYIDEKYDEIVKFAELEGFMEEKVRNYSSGMVSRLGFAIATIRNTPEILILDEVLSVGDMFFRKKSENRIKEMMHGGSTVLIVSHSTSVIRNNCTKAVWIEKGKLRAVGDPKEVCEAYEKMNQ